MNFNHFLPDYGTLPPAYFEKATITNPIELFWSDELLSLLRLCGAKEEMIGERASDYDRFLALTRALPLLEGHPTRAWIASMLEEYFNLKELPPQETAPDAWQKLCNCLLENPLSTKHLVSGAWLCDCLTIPSKLPEHITPVLNADLLLTTQAKTAAAWSEEIAATVSHFAQNRCQKIVLHLPHDFTFVTPSIYHVGRALTLAKKERETINLLTSQLLRELCVAAQRHNLLLVLICQNNATAACKLLNYCEAGVGLPRICWCVGEARESHALLDFSAQAHKNEIFAALPYDCVMTEQELLDSIASWKTRYPVGRLCFVTARDLRQTPFAQMHIEEMLKNAKTKI